MNSEQWQIERQRAWVAFAAAVMSHTYVKEDYSVGKYVEGVAAYAEEMLAEWEKTFPEPKETNQKRNDTCPFSSSVQNSVDPFKICGIPHPCPIHPLPKESRCKDNLPHHCSNCDRDIP